MHGKYNEILNPSMWVGFDITVKRFREDIFHKISILYWKASAIKVH
jgi:hypothetical protein